MTHFGQLNFYIKLTNNKPVQDSFQTYPMGTWGATDNTIGPSEVRALPLRVLQTGSVANVLASINTVISHSSSPPLLFSDFYLT
jgi:hypothetical protein